MTRESLDGHPIIGERDVFRQHIAAIEAIPEVTTIFQCIQNLVFICTVDTAHKMCIALTILFCGTNFTLFALRNVEDRVHQNAALAQFRRVFGKMADLVHKEVAITRQVEVIRTCFAVDGPVFRVGITAKAVGRTEVCSGVFYPNGAKRCLSITMGFIGRDRLSLREGIGVVCGCTVFGVFNRLCSCIPQLRNAQCRRAVHDTLTISTVRTTSRQDQTRGITGFRCARIHITLVRTNQFIQIPVTTAIPRPVIVGAVHIGTAVRRPAIDIVVPSSCILGIDFAFAEHLPIRIWGIAQRIIICASVCVQRIVTNQETVTVCKVVFQTPVCFTRKVGFLVGTNAPRERVHTEIAFCIHKVAFRVFIKGFAVNDVHANMRIAVHGIRKPAVARGSRQVILVLTARIRHIRIQNRNGFLVLCARCSFYIVAVFIYRQIGIRRDFDFRNVVAAMDTEKNRLTVPFRQHFHRAVCQIDAIVITDLTCRQTSIVQNIGLTILRKSIAQACPIPFGLCIGNFSFRLPLADSLVGVFGQIFVAIIQTQDPLCIRRQLRVVGRLDQRVGFGLAAAITGSSLFLQILIPRIAVNIHSNGVQDLVFGKLLVSEFDILRFQNLHALCKVRFIGDRNHAAISCREILFTHFKGIGILGCALDIVPDIQFIIVCRSGGILRELPFAIFVERSGVAFFVLVGVDFYMVVLLFCADGVSIQCKVASLPCDSYIAAVLPGCIQSIHHSVVHFDAGPSGIGIFFQRIRLSKVVKREIIPCGLVLVIIDRRSEFHRIRGLVHDLPLILHSHIITSGFCGQRDFLSKIRFISISVFRVDQRKRNKFLCRIRRCARFRGRFGICCLAFRRRCDRIRGLCRLRRRFGFRFRRGSLGRFLCFGTTAAVGTRAPLP